MPLAYYCLGLSMVSLFLVARNNNKQNINEKASKMNTILIRALWLMLIAYI